MREQRGFFKIVVIIAIFFVLSVYFDLDVRKVVNSDFIQNNWINLKQFIAQVLGHFRTLVNYLTNIVK